MDNISIEGVILTDLKVIHHPQGDIYHVMKKSDEGFKGYGEAYFSTIKKNETCQNVAVFNKKIAPHHMFKFSKLVLYLKKSKRFLKEILHKKN